MLWSPVHLLKLLKNLVAQYVHLRWCHLPDDGDGRRCPAQKVVYLMLHRNADQARDKSSRPPHLAPARSRWATLPILVVVPTLAARMSVSVVSRALCAQEYPAGRRISFLKAGIAQLLNRIPNVTHREHAG